MCEYLKFSENRLGRGQKKAQVRFDCGSENFRCGLVKNRWKVSGSGAREDSYQDFSGLSNCAVHVSFKADSCLK